MAGDNPRVPKGEIFEEVAALYERRLQAIERAWQDRMETLFADLYTSWGLIEPKVTPEMMRAGEGVLWHRIPKSVVPNHELGPLSAQVFKAMWEARKK